MSYLKSLLDPKSLFFRLFIALWLLSAGILLFSGFYINRTIYTEFQELVLTTRQEEKENILEAISEIFIEEEEDSSRQQHPMAINQLARTHNMRIIVQDLEGDIIHDTSMHGPGHHSKSRGRGMKDNEKQNHGEKTLQEKPLSEVPPEIIKENTYPLTINETNIGEITLLPMDGIETIFSPRELDFRSQVTKSIAAGGAISLILSAIISTIISFSISKPINKLRSTAIELKKGHLDKRVPLSGPREIEQLSISFNSMAENLEKTDYLKKKLTQDVSHELRNPVASIKGYLEAFQDGILDPDYDNLHLTIKELKRLENLAEELHELALIDFKETKPRQELLDLEELTDKIKSSTFPQVRKKGINLNYNLHTANNPEKEKLFIRGDKDLLYSAVKNLIQNAINHTEKGGKIELGLKKVQTKEELPTPPPTEEGPWAIIYVLDTGKGIPRDKLPYVFERFYRIDYSRVRDANDATCSSFDDKKGGSGIGLSLVKEWTHAMGGEVGVSSEEDKGSIFWLVFLAYGI